MSEELQRFGLKERLLWQAILGIVLLLMFFLDKAT